jgi:hypothetical protein
LVDFVEGQASHGQKQGFCDLAAAAAGRVEKPVAEIDVLGYLKVGSLRVFHQGLGRELLGYYETSQLVLDR